MDPREIELSCAQTNKVYADDRTAIPRNSILNFKKVPIKAAPVGAPGGRSVSRAAPKATAPAAASGCPFAGIIKATAPAVAPKVPEIVNDFYPRMFAQNPETKAFFNPANQFEEPPRQRMALANAVVAYASNIEDLTPLAGAVEVIAHKHAALTVQAAERVVAARAAGSAAAQEAATMVLVRTAGPPAAVAVRALSQRT